MRTNTKHKGRDLALLLLYMWEYHGSFDHPGVATFWRDRAESESLMRHTNDVARRVAGDVERLDDILKRNSTNWRLERMPLVDKNILRLAVWELLTVPETPMKVVMDESIDLARKYGSEESPAFINGVLDKVGAVLRPNSYRKKRSNR